MNPKELYVKLVAIKELLETTEHRKDRPDGGELTKKRTQKRTKKGTKRITKKGTVTRTKKRAKRGTPI